MATTGLYSQHLNNRKVLHLRNTIIAIVLIILAAATLFPICYMILSSFGPNVSTAGNMRTILPSRFTLESFDAFFHFSDHSLRWILNSVVVATGAVIGNVIFASMAGYAFAKIRFKGSKILFGLILGGTVIYWFSGASMQAVSTGAYRAVNYIKEHIKLDTNKAASIEDSKSVVKICTIYAQKGMLNIFIVIFSFTIAFACFNATLFASYLISIAVFGLFQALYMANAGGAWDNAKKVVEVDLHEKGSALHAAAVVGDTVGDPYKDTSSVALNPIIKFTTLFGLLAVEMAVAAPRCVSVGLGVAFFLIGLYFVYRSFYGMRIEPKKVD